MISTSTSQVLAQQLSKIPVEVWLWINWSLHDIVCVLSEKISCYDIKGYNLLVLEVVPIEESPAKVFGPLTEMETLFLHIKCGDQCSRPTTL